VVACLRETRFNISECARRLKVSRVTIYRLCKKHQLVLEDMH
jgi:transcriptional regulator of acetoin/glycerol metabolism